MSKESYMLLFLCLALCLTHSMFTFFIGRESSSSAVNQVFCFYFFLLFNSLLVCFIMKYYYMLLDEIVIKQTPYYSLYFGTGDDNFQFKQMLKSRQICLNIKKIVWWVNMRPSVNYIVESKNPQMNIELPYSTEKFRSSLTYILYNIILCKM